jgi:hypothetical protein
MNSINRAVLVVRPKEPFLHWLKRLPERMANVTLEDTRRDPHTYLVPLYDTDDEQDDLLRAHHADVFRAELARWWTDEAHWPRSRTPQVFREWFDFEFHSTVFDLVDEEIEKDE